MKKSTYRRYLRLTCTFLAFLLIVLSMPLNIIAVVEEAEQNITETTEDTTGKVVEVIERREEDVKHFQKPDGTYTAVSYANEVHRKDEDGNWQDIDNSLSSTRSASAYSTKDGRVSFSKSFEAGKELFSISEDGDTVAFSLMQKSFDLSTSLSADDSAKYGKVTASGITNPPLRAASWDTVEQAAEVDTSSRIIYESVNVGTDIEYILDGNDVKENIIIKQAQNDYAYDFRMTLVGLFASLCADGSVNIYDPTNKEIKYTIPAPYMYDSNGNTSYDVSYELEQVKEGIYILRVSASKEWINADERAFPVVIDPTITVVNTATDDTKIVDTSVHKNSTRTNGATENLLISDTDTAFFRFDIPVLPQGAILTKAEMQAHCSFTMSDETKAINLVVKGVETSWNENTLNGTTTIGMYSYQGNAVTMYGTPSTSSIGIRYIDITPLAKMWRSNDYTNYGFAIQRTGGNLYNVVIKSSESSTTSYRPRFMVDYLDTLIDGLYAIKNLGNSGMFMDVRDDSYKPAGFMQQTYVNSNPSVNDRGMIFKLTKVEGADRYIIRLMTNNSLTFTVTDEGEVQTKKISPYDDEVLAYDTYNIVYSETGYVIKPHASSKMIVAPSSSVGGDLGGETSKLATTNTVTDRARWQFIYYPLNEHFSGGTIYTDEEIIVGEEITFIPAGYSSQIGSNLFTINIDSPWATLLSSTSGGNIICKIHQNFPFELYLFEGNNNSDFFDAIETVSFTPRLLFEEGYYYIKNNTIVEVNGKRFTPYVTTSLDANGYINLSEWVNGNDILWKMYHYSDGYYLLVTYDQTKCLTVNSLVHGNLELTEGEDDWSLWKPIVSPDGSYVKLECKATASESLALSAPSFGTPKLQHSQIGSSSSSFEWSLMKLKVLNMSEPIAQSSKGLCWIANAKMYAQNYCETEIQMDFNAAIKKYNYIHADDQNPTGNGDSIVNIIKIFLNEQSSDNQNIDFTQFYPQSHDGVYSESDLIAILEAGDVVCVGRSSISSRGVRESSGEETDMGHFYTITGYMSINGNNYFVALNSASPSVNTAGENQNNQSDSNIDYTRGQIELFSYNKLLYGTNPLPGEEPDGDRWDLTVVRNVDSYNSAIIPITALD